LFVPPDSPYPVRLAKVLIASFHINDDAKKEALKRGYFVLQRSGDVVHSESGEHLMVL
jgi:hypothetical protein